MVLASTRKIFEDARRRKYAIGLMVTWDLGIVKPFIEAAEEQNSPVMLGATWGMIKSNGAERFLSGLVNSAEKAKVPVLLHLDHGRTYEECMSCVRNGWSSVMIDASDKPFNENIQYTREVTRACHAAGIPIEAELGDMPVISDQNIDFEKVSASTQMSKEAKSFSEMMTKPSEAERFVKETGIDILAVSVGQVHHFPTMENGVHPVKKIARLDFNRLKSISSVIGDAFLCMHAGSHVPLESLSKAVSMGVVKVNIGTAFGSIWTDSIRKQVMENPDEVWPTKVTESAEKAVKNATVEYLKVMNSAGKA